MKNGGKKYMFSIMFIGFAIILSLAIILTKAIYFEYHAKKEMVHQSIKVAYATEEQLNVYLDAAERNILALSESEFFQNYVERGTDKELLEQFFFSYVDSSSEIMKVRYINASGEEIIRVERDLEGGNPQIVETADLQDKSDRYFFTESITKEYDKVWFSSFDLNVENDEIQIPYTPTFRAILPLQKNNVFDGILIINYFVENYIEDLTTDSLYDVILYDEVGKIIYWNDDLVDNDTYLWGNSLPSDKDIFSLFPNVDPKSLLSTYTETDQMIQKKLNVSVREGIYILLKLNDGYLSDARKRLHNESVTILFVVLFFSVLVTMLIVRIFSKSLLNYDKIQLLYESMNSASSIARIGFWEYDARTQLVRWNGGAYDILEIGHDSMEMSFDTFQTFLPDTDRESLVEKFMESIHFRKDYYSTHEIITESGDTKYIEQRAKHFYDRFGKHVKTVGSIYDVTEIKETEKRLVELTKEQNILLGMFDISDSVLLRGAVRGENELTYVSNSIEKLLGYKKEDFLSQKVSFRNCIMEEDYKQVEQEIRGTDLLDKGFVRHKPYRIVTKDGAIKWVYAQTVAEKNDLGEMTHYIGYIVDMTKEKVYEETLEEQKRQIEMVNQKLEESMKTMQQTSAMYESERTKYKSMLELASDGVLFMDLDGNIIEFSKKTIELLGYDNEEMSFLTVFDWDKEMTDDQWTNLKNLMLHHSIEVERVHTRKDGSTYHAHITANFIIINGETFIYASVRDISKLKEIQKEVDDNRVRWQFAVEGNKDGLWDWNVDTNQVYFSPQWKRMIGFEENELENLLEEWETRVHPEDKPKVEKDLKDYFDGKSEAYINEHRILCKDGKYRWIRDRGIIIEYNSDHTPHRMIGTHTDITDYVEAMEFIRKQTYTDELTKLRNRKAYNERLNELMEQYQRYKVPFSFIMLDIDKFKLVNDNYGHAMGDKVLVALADILNKVSRVNDYVFRIGGEEFVILLTGTTLENAEIFAEKVRKEVEESLYQLFDDKHLVTISLGLVEVQKNDTNDSIFSRCDQHLYRAKQNGRNRVDK